MGLGLFLSSSAGDGLPALMRQAGRGDFIKLKQFRKANGLTQVEMAQAINVSVSFYTKIESGHKPPSYQFLAKMKEVFKEKLSVDEVFFKN